MAGEAERMEQNSNDLGSEIEQVRSDWQRKRADDSVPGATPLDNKEETPRAAQEEDQDENGSSDAEGDDGNPSA